MNLALAIPVALIAVTASRLAAAQNPGESPAATIGFVDVHKAYRLPPLKDSPGAPLNVAGLPLQVTRRAASLGLSANSAADAWQKAAALLSLSPHFADEKFSRDRLVAALPASALNRVLADSAVTRVRVRATNLWLDEPIDITGSGVTLDLTSVNLAPAATDPKLPWLIRVRNASNVTIRGGDFTGASSAILIQDSDSVIIRDAVFHDLRGAGVAATNSSHIHIARNRFNGVELAPVILHRGTSQSIVELNIIQSNAGFSNVAAGILLTDREVDLAARPRTLFAPDGYWPVGQPITLRLYPPHDNVIVRNSITGNRSSGVYSDGGVRNIISGNIIQGNAKEGICLDNGSAANVIAGNTIAQNGQRWGQPDEILAREFIATFGRLPDGTAAAKVPGISIDNAIYNVILGNHIEHNFGGGIKMVRTGYFNVIGLNSVISNNDGESPAFHFFGIELGNATADELSPELDFTPSRGNIVFSNLIRGTHYAGIFFAPGSDLNDVFDNTIMDATRWALESTQVMANSSLNNLTNIESVNITSGLNPAGLK
jgi:parallel beta-helix repeat protein